MEKKRNKPYCYSLAWILFEKYNFLFFPFNSSIKQQIPRPEYVKCSAPFGVKIATTEHNE